MKGLRVATFVAIASVLAFWAAQIAENFLASRLAVSVDRSRLPMVLAGMQLRLDRLSLPNRYAEETFYLVVISDDCPACQNAVSRWVPHLESAAFPGDKALVLVSLNGRQLIDKLDHARTKRGIEGRTIQLNRSEAKLFAVTSGLLWTPAIVEVGPHLQCQRVFDDLTVVVSPALQKRESNQRGNSL